MAKLDSNEGKDDRRGDDSAISNLLDAQFADSLGEPKRKSTSSGDSIGSQPHGRTTEPTIGTSEAKRPGLASSSNATEPPYVNNSQALNRQSDLGSPKQPSDSKPINTPDVGSPKIQSISGVPRQFDQGTKPSNHEPLGGEAGRTVGPQAARASLPEAGIVQPSAKSVAAPGDHSAPVSPLTPEFQHQQPGVYSPVGRSDVQQGLQPQKPDVPTVPPVHPSGLANESPTSGSRSTNDRVSESHPTALSGNLPASVDRGHGNEQLAARGDGGPQIGQVKPGESAGNLTQSRDSVGGTSSANRGTAAESRHGIPDEISQSPGRSSGKINSGAEVRSAASEVKQTDGKIAEATGGPRLSGSGGHGEVDGARHPEMNGKVAEANTARGDRHAGDKAGKDDKVNNSDAPAVFMQFLGGSGGSSFVGTRSFGWPFVKDKDADEKGNKTGARETKGDPNSKLSDRMPGVRQDAQGKVGREDRQNVPDKRAVAENQKGVDGKSGKGSAGSESGPGSPAGGKPFVVGGTAAESAHTQDGGRKNLPGADRKDNLGEGRLAEAGSPSRRGASYDAGVGVGLVGAGGKIIEEFVAVLKGIIPADTPRARQVRTARNQQTDDSIKTTVSPRARTQIQPTASPKTKPVPGELEVTQPTKPPLKGPARPYVRLHNPDGTYGGAMQPGGVNGGFLSGLPIRRMLSETAKLEPVACQDVTVPNRSASAKSGLANPGFAEKENIASQDKRRMPPPRLIDDSKTMESIPMINPDLLARSARPPAAWLQDGQTDVTQPAQDDDTLAVGRTETAVRNDVAHGKAPGELEDTLIEEDEPEPARRSTVAGSGEFRKVRYANRDIDELEQTWPLADEQESAQSNALANNSYLYIVKAGDTIESVAAKVLGDLALAPLLFKKNRQHVLAESEYGVHDLYPGVTIELPTPAEIAEFRMA